MKASSQTQKNVGRILLAVLFGVLFLAGVSLITLSVWYVNTYDVEFKELLLTLKSPLDDTGSGGVVKFLLASCLPFIALGAVVFVTLTVLSFRLPPLYRFRRLGAALCTAVFLGGAVTALFSFRIPAYLLSQGQETLLYDDYYADPASLSVTAGKQKKNLIYIYLESMETTYASEIKGGAQKTNCIPHLTELAEENVSFSDSGKLGGFHSTDGTKWTMGALLATTSGIPFSLSVFGENSHNSLSGKILPGVTTLGDILDANGYTQEFLVGSDASFAGQSDYLRLHGNYRIYDLATARRNGDLPTSDYSNGWWGFEDYRLYEIAKREVTELAASGKPFNLTMMTIDTHHTAGYVCEQCQNETDNRLANVVHCADRLVSNFVSWCREQDFYEDTVIVITGDHPRMDRWLVDGIDYYDRTVYNCFLNAACEVEGSASDRIFTAMDIYPTVLAAMGFSIEGQRLGLGTNLFSQRKTLAELYGYEWLDSEIAKYSDFYVDHFCKEP